MRVYLSMNGRVQSLNWTGGQTLKLLFNETHSPVALCRNPAAFCLYSLGANNCYN